MTQLEYEERRKAAHPIEAFFSRKYLKKGVVAIAITGAVLLSLGAYSGDQQLIEDTYTVQKGDTLWSISETYLKKNTGGRRYILEFQEGIKELNPWLLDTDCQLKPGDKLRINYWIKKGEQTD